MDLNNFAELQRRLSDAEKELHRQEGKQRTLIAQLKSEFGVSSTEEAEAELEKLDAECVQLSSKASKLSKRFMKRWGDRLQQ